MNGNKQARCLRYKSWARLSIFFIQMGYNNEEALEPDLLTLDEILAGIGRNQAHLRKLGVKKLGVFGSFVRGEAGPESDIDFIVELEKKTFDSYMDVKFFLEDLFNRKVDLVLADAIKPRLRPYIENEVIYATGI